MIVIRGASSKIALELGDDLLPQEEKVIRLDRGEELDLRMRSARRYLFCQGLLHGKKLKDQTQEEISAAFWINAGQIMQYCEQILEHNAQARICILGSESGFGGSFDLGYGTSKSAIHCYIQTRPLATNQQLIGIAPGIIEDSEMTERRKDRENLERRKNSHPKGRFLRSIEVAKLIHFCLYVDEGYLSNIVIRMNGGEHTR